MPTKKILSLAYSIIITVFSYCQTSSDSDLEYGFYLLDKNNTKDAEVIFQKHLHALESEIEIEESYYDIAVAYNQHLLFDLSITYAKEGLKQSSKTKTKELYQVIAISHLDLKNYDLAEEYYNSSLKQGNLTQKPLSNDYNLIGEITRLRGKPEQSTHYFWQAIKTGDENSLPIYYNNIGLAYLELNEMDSSSYYLNLARDLILDQNLINEEIAINISFGKLNLKKNMPQVALEFFKNTISDHLPHHPDKYELYQDAHEGMYLCYEQLNLYEQALTEYKTFHYYQKKIFDFTQQSNIFQNQIINERNNHANELEILNQKIEVESKYKWALIVLFSVILIVVFLIIYMLLLKTKSVKQRLELVENTKKIQDLELQKSKLKNENLVAERIQSEQDQKIKNLESSKLKEQLDYQSRQLTTTALHLMNKNETLADIKNKVSEISLSSSTEVQSELKRIIYLIKENLQLDNDWEIFKTHFTEVHPDFFTTLINKFPTLTPDELKLCAYLKIQLSSKEIARLINITVVAINKRRNRMRKKLNLSPESDLHEFLLNIDNSRKNT